ncbi:MAG: hypothetical protein P8X90_33555, partial [Desulfobacterales bacterium]
MAIVEAKGEPIRAREKALNEVLKALNVLRLYVKLFYFRTTDVQLRVLAYRVTGLGGPVIENPQSKKIVYCGERPSGLLQFNIDKPNLGKMRKWRLGEISELLKKGSEELTSFEKKILLGVNWYGSAVDMTDLVLKFLNCAIVLEVLV